MLGTYHNYVLFANSNNLLFFRGLILLFLSWKQNRGDKYTQAVVTSRNTYARIATGTISFDKGNTTFVYKPIIVLIDENPHYTSLILDPDDLSYTIYDGQIPFSFEGKNEKFGRGFFAYNENQLAVFLRNNWIIGNYCSLISIRSHFDHTNWCSLYYSLKEHFLNVNWYFVKCFTNVWKW